VSCWLGVLTEVKNRCCQPAGRVRRPRPKAHKVNGMALQAGLSGRAALVVGAADTARTMRSGDLDVLSTPRLIALCEEATCRAVDGCLEAGHTSVGSRIEFDHVRASRVGSQVTAEAVLEEINGKRLEFSVSAYDLAGPAGRGRVTRVVVETAAFLAKAR
jgi:fluoroacetyl-CoA thioesterase